MQVSNFLVGPISISKERDSVKDTGDCVTINIVLYKGIYGRKNWLILPSW